MYIVHLVLSCLTLLALPTSSHHLQQPTDPAQYYKFPSLRERARIQDDWRDERLAQIPALLKKYNVDAWLVSVVSRETYSNIHDHHAFGTDESTRARRGPVVLFLATQPEPLIWVDNTGAVWPELQDALYENNITRIAINVDRNIAFGAGLHVGEKEALVDELGSEWMLDKVVNEPMLGVEYVATRVHGQLEYYRKLQETTWALIEEAFSERVIEVGITSTEDVEWWFREKMQEQNVTTWNQPRVSVLVPESFPGWEGSKDVIKEGDLLHVDFGITAMGMNTDTQHMAYVLREGEKDAPDGLKEGLRKSNRMQEIVLENMQAGKTGNEVLTSCLDQMEKEGIQGQIYCHPIGDWGHDAGAISPNTYQSSENYQSSQRLITA